MHVSANVSAVMGDDAAHKTIDETEFDGTSQGLTPNVLRMK